MPCGEQETVPPHPYPLASPDGLGPMDPSHFAQPSHISVPETTGRVQLERHSLYYELRGLEHQQKVLLLSPLACTIKFFGGLADAISSQHQVLIYDYRGIGKSTNPHGRNWTRCELIALSEPILCNINIYDQLDYDSAAALHLCQHWVWQCDLS